MSAWETAIRNRVTAQYAETEARLTDDPKWLELTHNAEQEAAQTPDFWLARNMRSMYLETQMPRLTFAGGVCFERKETT